jgi:hypothetical protein
LLQPVEDRRKRQDLAAPYRLQSPVMAVLLGVSVERPTCKDQDKQNEAHCEEAQQLGLGSHVSTES